MDEEFDVDGCLADLSDLWVSFAKRGQTGDGYTREYFRGAMNLTESVMECIKKHRRERPKEEWKQGSLLEYMESISEIAGR